MRFTRMTAAAGLLLAMTPLARAVTITNFDSFTPTGPYASWTTATITSGPTALRVQSTGFGGSYCNLPNVSVAGTDTLQLSASVSAGVAGFIVAVGDTSGHEWNYAWYGNPAGGGAAGSNDYVFTKAFADKNFSTGAAGQLDLANIDYIHIQVDPGAFANVPYDVSFNDLSAIATPEPACLAGCAIGGLIGLRRRR